MVLSLLGEPSSCVSNWYSGGARAPQREAASTGVELAAATSDTRALVDHVVHRPRDDELSWAAKGHRSGWLQLARRVARLRMTPLPK
jgi:hypothetical protein